jgi:putative holliday junction resolvase
MNRVIALDYGEKRIGVALSDPLGLTAQAQPYLANDENFWINLAALIDEKSVSSILLGLPSNRHGEDTKKTTEVRAFSTELETKTKLPVTFQDERYSTVAVERHLISADVSRKKRKKVVDGQAAAFFLQGYLDRS